MEFRISKENILSKTCRFYLDEESLEGVRRITGIVAQDLKKVFGELPVIDTYNEDLAMSDMPILVCTLGYGKMAQMLNDEGSVDTEAISGKREVYSFSVIEHPAHNGASALAIVGSDKRGTIYGLFKLSELLGVSPLVNWNSVMPAKLESATITDEDSVVSKEPSVRFRGFFINDEWPAFGNWCEKNFGGFNAECYAGIFELLLRLKGNYLWPAMWSAVFSEDGPGLKNAELADEMGVVMGMSHHEPCLRNGEEYSHVRGKDSIYGDAWNFRTNEAGITKFWEDGLKRNGKFENVITVGMRGEADSKIMGEDATLKDNIDLLRDVLKCQNRLIRENVNENLDVVPRMLALYKEVEPFYYGDANTEGLMNDPELDGVTLMLCDDNFGNLRTVPSEEMKAHRGGFGMYYHFDYHGWPISFEWVNSSYLPKVWDQMTYAYESGIRDLWIVNVGDVFTQEYPLSFFLDLAYDYEKWGIGNINAPREYTKKWVKENFESVMNAEQLKETENLLMAYTKIASSRRPEAMNETVYCAKTGEASAHAKECALLMDRCEALYKSIPSVAEFAFFQLVYYPLMGNMNIHKMWTDTTMNHYLAEMGATAATAFAGLVYKGIEFDRNLIEKLHTAADGRWYGMGMSEHIGFRNWNEEECHNPITYDFAPANKPRIIAEILGTGQHTEGGDWTGRPLTMNILDKTGKGVIRLYSGSAKEAEFEVSGICEGILLDKTEGTVPAGGMTDLTVTVQSEKIGNIGRVDIKTVTGGNIHIDVNVYDNVLEADGMKIIEADEFVEAISNEAGESFIVIPEYGKFKCGVKVSVPEKTYACGEGPSLIYEVETSKAGEYFADIYMTPCNPPFTNGKLEYGFGCLDKDEEVNLSVVNAVPTGFRVGDDYDDWKKGVLMNVRINSIPVTLNKGKNLIKISAMSPALILQRIVIRA